MVLVLTLCSYFKLELHVDGSIQSILPYPCEDLEGIKNFETPHVSNLGLLSPSNKLFSAPCETFLNVLLELETTN